MQIARYTWKFYFLFSWKKLYVYPLLKVFLILKLSQTDRQDETIFGLVLSNVYFYYITSGNVFIHKKNHSYLEGVFKGFIMVDMLKVKE